MSGKYTSMIRPGVSPPTNSDEPMEMSHDERLMQKKSAARDTFILERMDEVEGDDIESMRKKLALRKERAALMWDKRNDEDNTL